MAYLVAVDPEVGLKSESHYFEGGFNSKDAGDANVQAIDHLQATGD